MNLWLRLLRVWLGTLGAPKLGVLGESVLKLRVTPGDLDLYGHMNNARYLAIMDLGRIDLIWRTGMGRVAKEKKWFPLVASVHIHYKKSLRPFQAFELHTRILGWDGQWFYLEQHFVSEGREMARAAVRGVFRGSSSIPPQEVLDALGSTEVSPVLSTEVTFRPKRRTDGVV